MAPILSEEHIYLPTLCCVSTSLLTCIWIKGLIMDRCVLLTSIPECVVSPRGETTHSGVDVNNTHLSIINPDYNMTPAISIRTNRYSAY